jgi:hypothetical protein
MHAACRGGLLPPRAASKLASMHEVRKQQLADFADWVKQHITGDEKGEAQIFLDRLFRAFGLKGVRPAPSASNGSRTTPGAPRSLTWFGNRSC